MELHSVQLLPKYPYTNDYSKEFRTERARRMVELTTRYISLSCHCKVSEVFPGSIHESLYNLKILYRI